MDTNFEFDRLIYVFERSKAKPFDYDLYVLGVAKMSTPRMLVHVLIANRNKYLPVHAYDVRTHSCVIWYVQFNQE